MGKLMVCGLSMRGCAPDGAVSQGVCIRKFLIINRFLLGSACVSGSCQKEMPGSSPGMSQQHPTAVRSSIIIIIVGIEFC